MKKGKRIVALALAVILVLALSAPAFAAQYKRVSGTGTVTVVTGKRTWGIFRPQVTVKNVGSNAVTIHVYNSKFVVVDKIETLEKGRSTTFTLKPNQTFQISYMGHWTQGGGANIEVSAKRGIKDIY